MLGVEACRRGHRVGFFSASGLVNTLVEAREEKQLERVFRKLSRFHLVILDELGYIPFSQEGAQLLYQVFANRYERTSLLVTSNRLSNRFSVISSRACREELLHLFFPAGQVQVLPAG